MTRRLVVLLVSIVTATLLIAGLGTLVLANVRARHTTEQDLRKEAARVAANIGDFFDGTDGQPLTKQQDRQRLRQLQLVRRLLDLDGFAVMTVAPNGALEGDVLPNGVTAEELQIDRLRAGGTSGGNNGNLAYAASAVPLPKGRLAVVVLAREANSGLGTSARYFLLAAAATALLGALAALVVGRQLTRPIRAVTSATKKIAAGQLSTRLPEPSANATDELADLSRNVNSMAEALERSRVLEQQFLLSVSHDLRTPLTSIRGFAEAINDGAGDPARAAAVILSESRRLERLVADLLDLAKLQASSFSLHPEQLDLTQLAIVAVEGFEPDAAERGILIRAVPASSPAPVVADHDRLAQVAANLIENAIKYASSRVSVSVSVDGDRAVLAVEDDGPGIDARDLPHVFERLYVARRQPSRQENSSGLGLAIVKQLVGAMGGDVTATSQIGEGTMFTIRMPLAVDPGATAP
jgi:signal transduction histidine kinase